MSFILDALKKSELERQRQAIPGLVESGAVRPRPRLPGWAIALCVLLGINLVVLSVVLVRGWMGTPSAPAGAATGATAAGVQAPPLRGAGAQAPQPGTGAGAATAGTPRAASAGSAAPTTDHFSPLDAPPVYAPEIPVTSAPGGLPAEPALPRTPEAREGAGLRDPVHVPRRKDPVLSTDDYKPSDEEVLPTINELNLKGDQALPELHLDVHVYATKPAERFVFINMRKYHEGATLQEGPTIERIRRDGVILDYQGLRFLLPRQ